MSDLDQEEGTVLEAVQELAEQPQNEEIDDQVDESDEQEDTPEPKAKKEWVDFTPEQQAKFNDVYKQVKMSDTRNQMLTKMLEKQQEKLDELSARFSQTDQAEAENILKTRLQEARDEGDIDKEIKIFHELADLKKGPQVQEKPKPVADLPDDPETRYVVALAQETDDSGQPLRPWLSDKHPRYKSMLTQATIIAAELESDGAEASVKNVMKLLDERMNKKQNPRAPDPMSANLTTNRNTNNIKPKLTAQEKAIAAKLGMSEADYLDGKVNYGAKR